MIMEKNLNLYMYKLFLVAIVTLMTFPCFALKTAYATDLSVSTLNKSFLQQMPITPNYDVPVALDELVLAPEEVLQVPDNKENDDVVVSMSSEVSGTVFESESLIENIVHNSLVESVSAANNSLSIGGAGVIDTANYNMETSPSLPSNDTTTIQMPTKTKTNARVLLAVYSKNEDIEGSSGPVLVLGTDTDSPSGVYSFSSGDGKNDETLIQYLLSRFGIYLGFFAAMLSLIYIIYSFKNRERLSNFGDNLIERR